MSNIDVSSSISDDTLLLVLAGKLLYGDSVHAVEEAVRHSAHLRPRRVVINLQRVSKIDAAGLGVLALASHIFGSTGAVLVLANTPPMIHRLLVLTGLDRFYQSVAIRDLGTPVCGNTVTASPNS